MPFVRVNDVHLYYRLEGRPDLPVLALAHALGTDHGMWAPQMAALLDHFRLLRWDARGHGASGAPPGDYSIGQLGGDLLSITAALGIDRFAFCGLSMGGMTGQWLATNHPGRLTHLVLANTSAHYPDPTVMEARRTAVIERGMAAVADGVMQRFFSPKTLEGNSPWVALVRQTLLAAEPTGYAGCCAAVRDFDHRDLVGGIQTPTLILSGERDVSTPWAGHGDFLAARIASARVMHLAAAHLSNLERPRSFTAALLEFLLRPPEGELATGERTRRAVLGDAHVDRAAAAAAGFNSEFQDLITRYAWGTVWSRPALDFRTRRLLVLAMTAALGRWEEFRLHVRTGLAAELEWCDLKEVLLQAAIYGGVPCANTAFQIAREEGGAGPQ